MLLDDTLSCSAVRSTVTISPPARVLDAALTSSSGAQPEATGTQTVGDTGTCEE